MRELVTSGLLVLLAAGNGEAQLQPAPAATGRELLAAGDSLGAAEAFHGSLRASGLSRFTVQLAVYCDISNLERQVRASGNPPEIFVLRRSIDGRPCLGLYWGLFASPGEARAAVSRIPGVLRAAGQKPVAVSAILPPGEPRVATAPPPPTRAPAPRPAPPVVAPIEPEPMPAERVVTPPPPVAFPTPEVSSPPMPEAPSDRVPAMEIAAGYAYLDDDAFPVTGGSFEAGWILSGCANLNRGLGVVGEVNAEYKTEDALGALTPFDRDLGLLGVHGGLRYTHRRGGLVTRYIQGLAGATRTSVEVAGVREVEDDFSIQPGVGLVFRLSDSVGLGLGGDYRLVFGERDERNEFRLHADLVFGIASR